MLALEVSQGVPVHTLEGFDSEPLFTEDLGNAGPVTVILYWLLHTRRGQNRNILFFRFHFLETQRIGFNRFADQLEMVTTRRHVRVPEFLGKCRIRALTPANQPDSATAHIWPLGAFLCQRLDRHIPVAVGPPLVIKPDAEENQRPNRQLR